MSAVALEPRAIVELLAGALRGERPSWPAARAHAADVLEAAAAHGVEALLAGMVRDAARAPGWPETFRETLAERARALAAAEVLRRQELAVVLSGLRAAGVAALVMKGAELAYTHYPQPWLRPMADVDLLIAPAQIGLARRCIERLGYEPATHYDGHLVTHQVQYRKAARHGVRHDLDLHTQVANPHAFADRLTFAELETDSVRIPALGDTARGLSNPHALLLACIHRVAHHFNSDRKIWLYDIHLLASRLDEDEHGTDAVVTLATQRGLRAVCASGLASARQRLGTPTAARLVDVLSGSGEAEDVEPTAVFLRPGRTKTDILVSDLRTLAGWRPRLRLIREHLFPPAAYVRRLYAVSHPALLPLAYTRRIVSGVAKWLQRR